MTNEEVQEIIDRADDEYDRLKDRVHEQYDEIQRLTAESTKWESKFYDEAKKVDKAIEKIESIRIYGLRSGKTLFATLLNEILDILKGVDKE